MHISLIKFIIIQFFLEGFPSATGLLRNSAFVFRLCNVPCLITFPELQNTPPWLKRSATGILLSTIPWEQEERYLSSLPIIQPKTAVKVSYFKTLLWLIITEIQKCNLFVIIYVINTEMEMFKHLRPFTARRWLWAWFWGTT